MRARTLSLICLLMCLAIAIPMLAQQKNAAPAAPAATQQKSAAAADPLSGTWTGDWGPSPGDRNQVSVDLKWDGKALTGTVHSINPKRDDVALSKSTYAAATRAVHLEADVKSPQAVHYVIDGKLASGSMTGSWNHDVKKGDFKLTKK